MAKKSILSEAQETIIEAAKTGVAVAKLAATAGLAAAGPAAAGVVLDSVSKGLQRAEQKVTNVTPSEASETFGIMPKKTAMRTAKRKKQAVAKKRSSPKKKRATRKKKKTTAKNTAKTKRGRSRRKR
jgi:hypothetical protein